MKWNACDEEGLAEFLRGDRPASASTSNNKQKRKSQSVPEAPTSKKNKTTGGYKAQWNTRPKKKDKTVAEIEEKKLKRAQKEEEKRLTKHKRREDMFPATKSTMRARLTFDEFVQRTQTFMAPDDVNASIKLQQFFTFLFEEKENLDIVYSVCLLVERCHTAGDANSKRVVAYMVCDAAGTGMTKAYQNLNSMDCDHHKFVDKHIRNYRKLGNNNVQTGLHEIVSSLNSMNNFPKMHNEIKIAECGKKVVSKCTNSDQLKRYLDLVRGVGGFTKTVLFNALASAYVAHNNLNDDMIDIIENNI